MTIVPLTDATPLAASALAPIQLTLAGMRARQGVTATHGLYPGLLVADTSGWTPASRLTDGSQVPELIDTAKQRWGAQPHVAAALAWKSYTYWLALPAVTGYAAARRVPLLRPEDVLLRFHDHQPFLTIGLRRAAVAVLPSDPLAATALPDIQVVRDEAELLTVLRETLRDAHLDLVLEQIRARVNVGRRTLLGSLASGVAYGMTRSRAHPDTIETTLTLVTALGVADLVELTLSDSGDVQVWRRTCCLAFTLPEPKICSGCCIRLAD